MGAILRGAGRRRKGLREPVACGEVTCRFGVSAMSSAVPSVSAAEYRRGVLLVTGAIVVWSSAGVLARWVEVAPWTTLFWRSVFAAGALAAYLLVRDGARAGQGFARLGRVGMAMGLCFAASMICFINALELTTVAAVLVFQAAAPLFAAVLAFLFLRERVTARVGAAIALSLFGVGLIVMQSGEAGRLWGNILSAGMGLTYAMAVVLTTEATLLGVVVVAVVSAPMAEFAVPARDMVLLAVFGVFQMGLALIMFTEGVRLIPSADAGLISVLEAVLAPIWVWAVFAENPGGMTLVGGAVVIVAVGWAATESK
jgi:drug/metabolite transporter (DMT)-like permease